MIDKKEFDDYLGDEYPPIVNQFTKKLPLSPNRYSGYYFIFSISSHIATCWSCGEYKRLINDWD